MLQKFRTIDVIWDLANKNFHETIELSSSDEQGRRIVVQVLDNGQVVDLTGVGLNLYWETKDKHYMGLDNFTALDIRKGLFELYATTELLSNVGTLKGHLYLVTAEGEAITSLSLDINVNQGINTEAVESQNSFSALTDALSRLVAIESQEQERKDNELERADAESIRQTNETQRESAELQRFDTFNNKLVEWGGKYDTAEAQRNNSYEVAETERVSDYQSAEQGRDTLYDIAEQARESSFQSQTQQLYDQYAPRLSKVEAFEGELIQVTNVEPGVILDDFFVYKMQDIVTLGGFVALSNAIPGNTNETTIFTLPESIPVAGGKDYASAWIGNQRQIFGPVILERDGKVLLKNTTNNNATYAMFELTYYCGGG